MQDAVVVHDVDLLAGRDDLHVRDELAAVLIDLRLLGGRRHLLAVLRVGDVDHDVLQSLVGGDDERLVDVLRLAAHRLVLGDLDLGGHGRRARVLHLADDVAGEDRGGGQRRDDGDERKGGAGGVHRHELLP